MDQDQQLPLIRTIPEGMERDRPRGKRRLQERSRDPEAKWRTRTYREGLKYGVVRRATPQRADAIRAAERKAAQHLQQTLNTKEQPHAEH